MKRIKKDELYRNLDGFLKTKGVELKPGSYTDRIQRVCGLLSDVINAGQSGLERAREETEKRLEKVRQAIHEKTAPKVPPTPTPPPTTAPPPNQPHPEPLRAKRSPKVAVKKPARRPASMKQRTK